MAEPARRKRDAAPKARRGWLPQRFDFRHEGVVHHIEITRTGKVYVSTKNGGTVRHAPEALRAAVLDWMERSRREAEARAASERRAALGIHTPTDEEVAAVAASKART